MQFVCIRHQNSPSEHNEADGTRLDCKSQFFEKREYEELFGSSVLPRDYKEATEEDAMDRHHKKNVTQDTPWE